MTASPDLPSDPGATSALDAALAQLRSQPVPRAVEIADEVLRRSLEAPRPAVLVRGRGRRYDFVSVSSTVITLVVQARLDDGLEDAAVSRVLLDVSRDRELLAATIELYVRYGADILEQADRARDLARAALEELLGPVPVEGAATPVVVGHVHVSDITRGDPHLVDPDEE